MLGDEADEQWGAFSDVGAGDVEGHVLDCIFFGHFVTDLEDPDALIPVINDDRAAAFSDTQDSSLETIGAEHFVSFAKVFGKLGDSFAEVLATDFDLIDFAVRDGFAGRLFSCFGLFLI